MSTSRTLIADGPGMTMSDGPELTRGEREVLRLLAGGLAANEIALYLHMSMRTVENHRRRMMVKLDVQSIAELTSYAVRKGLGRSEQ
jgi:DNA-binding NarL/FixJ family response regulator